MPSPFEMLQVPGPDGQPCEVKLSSPEKVLWPATTSTPAITKRDLVDYHLAVAEAFLAHNGGRPITLQRFPDGIEGEEFFSKRPPQGMPDFIETVMLTYPSKRRHRQMVLTSPAGVVWTAQMGTITYHPWPVSVGPVSVGPVSSGPVSTGSESVGSAASALDNPDELRIDLDPQPGRGFADATTAALALRDLLGELGLRPFVKTSGNRGLHVFAPIQPTHEFQDVRHGVIGIARELERRLPELVTASWWKEERGERVFVDFNQANRDRTLAGAYSPRPLPGAPVSMPISWEELEAGIDPADFTVSTVPGILAERPDAWAQMHDEPAGDLAPALALWDEQLAAGQGELNFPPDYPKMPGEPPRVPPSKRRTDRDDQDYMAPKAERDAEWGTAITPPYSPMLARPLKDIPDEPALYEPKWDGFRALIWRSGDQVEIGSRNERPMTRYFPELVAAFTEHLPDKVVLDGEIIMVDPDAGDRLDFDLLQQRIHPAASRIAKLSKETPASFVAFDILAHGMTDYTEVPFEQRRAVLEDLLTEVPAPIHLTPATRDRDLARQWFTEFEGAGLDGIMVKPLAMEYVEDKRVMVKIKHVRTADCVVAGYRTHKNDDQAIGSLMLGLFGPDGQLHQVGVIGALPMTRRKELFTELQPLVTEFEGHPWQGASDQPASRWNAGKDTSFTPLRPERVVEVKYDHMEGDRFRHTAQWVGWRPDRTPESCTYEQLEEPVSYDLAKVLGWG